LRDAGDSASAIAVDGNGNVVVTGSPATIKYSGAGVALWTNVGGQRLAVDGSGNVIVLASDAISKYSGVGVPLWTNLYNGSRVVALAVDGSGNVFETGSLVGSGSGEDYATIKYSGAGASLWTNRYHGPGYGDNAAAAMTVDASGNVVVTGYSYASNGYADYATIKYSNTGVPLWTNRYDGPAHNTEEAHAVGVDGGGNVFVT